MRHPHIRRPSRSFLYATLFTTASTLLVAASIGPRLGFVNLSALLAIVGAFGFFYLLFPGSRAFAVGLANGLALYTCLFAYIMEANFAGVSDWARPLGFLLPVLAFVAGAWLQRGKIRGIVAATHPREIQHLGRVFGWCLPAALMGMATFFLPAAGLEGGGLDASFLGAMGLLALLAGLLSRNISIFLLDSSLLFEKFFQRLGQMFTAVFAFLTFYSLLMIVFGAIYRLVSHYATQPQFAVYGVGRELSFAEALYFSLVTLATLGYGDIVPISEGTRVLVAAQTLTGVVLLLFGFAEIQHAMQQRDTRRKDRHDDET